MVARVNGPAAGAGLALALARGHPDRGRHGRMFIVAPVKIGLSGGEMGISYLLPRLIGLSRATELCLTGRKLGADEAREFGLVTRVAGAGVARWSRRRGRGPVARECALQHLDDAGVARGERGRPELEHALHLENRTQVLAGYGSDMAEAVRLFGEAPACLSVLTGGAHSVRSTRPWALKKNPPGVNRASFGSGLAAARPCPAIAGRLADMACPLVPPSDRLPPWGFTGIRPSISTRRIPCPNATQEVAGFPGTAEAVGLEAPQRHDLKPS